MKNKFEEIWEKNASKVPKKTKKEILSYTKYILFYFLFSLRYFIDLSNLKIVNLIINIVLVICMVLIFKALYQSYKIKENARDDYSIKVKNMEFFLNNFVSEIFDDFTYSVILGEQDYPLNSPKIETDTFFSGNGKILNKNFYILGEKTYFVKSLSKPVYSTIYLKDGFIIEIQTFNKISEKMDIVSRTAGGELKKSNKIQNRQLNKHFRIYGDEYKIPLLKIDGFYADEFIKIIKRIYPYVDYFGMPEIRIAIEPDNIKLYLPGNPYFFSSTPNKKTTKKNYEKMCYIKELCEFLIDRFN